MEFTVRKLQVNSIEMHVVKEDRSFNSLHLHGIS